MKKLFVVGVAFTALIAGRATAADLRVPVRGVPVAGYSWTGCYVGGNIGADGGRQNAQQCARPLGAFNVGPSSIPADSSEAIGGVHAGCNVEGTYGVARGWVFGIEGD